MQMAMPTACSGWNSLPRTRIEKTMPTQFLTLPSTCSVTGPVLEVTMNCRMFKKKAIEPH